MKAEHIPGEPTRFHVTADSWQCSSSFGCKKIADGDRTPGPMNLCNWCGAPLERRTHLVDIAALAPIGQCSCEDFTIRQRKELGGTCAMRYAEALGPQGRANLDEADRQSLRCKHLKAARTHALDTSIAAYQRQHMGGNP